MSYKPAVAEICWETHEQWFRCPYCYSLNLNQRKPDHCPDCGKGIAYPDIVECDCAVSGRQHVRGVIYELRS